MTLYGTLGVVFKPPTEPAYGVKNPSMAQKVDFSTFADFLTQWHLNIGLQLHE